MIEDSIFSHHLGMNRVKRFFHFINQYEKTLLLVMAFDCFFGIGTASFTFLALRHWNWHFYAYFQLILGWTTIIYFLGYDYVLFSRLGDLEYLYEKNSTPALDIFFGSCILIGNLWMASEVLTFNLKRCYLCSGTFKQHMIISQFSCVCVCHSCRRRAEDCPVCKSASDLQTGQTISVEANYPLHEKILISHFIQLIFQYIPFLCMYQFNMENYLLLSVFETIHNLIKFGKAIGVLLFCLVIFRCIKDFVTNLTLKNGFLTGSGIIYPWWHFVSTCDLIMLATSAFDCAFGIGAYNFTCLIFFSLKKSLAFVILIPGWIVISVRSWNFKDGGS